MSGFCRVSLLGNLGSQPEVRYTPNGAMNVQFSIAVSPRKRDGEEPKATWYRVTAWDKDAERIDKMVQAGHIAKGRTLYVEGKLEPRTYTKNDGQQATSMDVTLSCWEFTGGGQQQGNTPLPNMSDVQY